MRAEFHPRWRRVAGSSIKAAVAIGSLGWLFASVDLGDLTEALARGRLAPVSLGLLVLVASGLPLAARLYVLASPYGLPWKSSLKVTVISLFFNQILPATVGGESYRAYRLKTLGSRWSTGIGLILVERLIGSLVLLVPAVLCGFLLEASARERLAIFGRPSISPPFPVLLLSGAVLGLLALWWLRSKGTAAAFLRRRLAQVVESALEVTPTRLFAAAGLSGLFHGLRLVGFHYLLRAMGQSVHWTHLLIVLAVTLIVSSVPISIGSLGIKEGAIVFALKTFGVPGPEALAVALWNRVALLVLALVGGWAFYRGLNGFGPDSSSSAQRITSAARDPSQPS